MPIGETAGPIWVKWFASVGRPRKGSHCEVRSLVHRDGLCLTEMIVNTTIPSFDFLPFQALAFSSFRLFRPPPFMHYSQGSRRCFNCKLLSTISLGQRYFPFKVELWLQSVYAVTIDCALVGARGLEGRQQLKS